MTTMLTPPHHVSTRDAKGTKLLTTLALELRRELSRVERGLAPGESSDERDELLQALLRLEDGSYGICVECARPIPAARLEVMPATRYCVRCAR